MGSLVVFGATGGIGEASCRLLHARGARLHLVARGENRLRALAAELGASASVADATVASEVEAAFAAAGDVIGAACFVGSILLKPLRMVRDDEWAQTLTLNLTSAFHVLRAAARSMRGRQGGSILLMSSAAAVAGLPHHEAIAAAKGGVDAMVRAAAASLAEEGIRVNAIAPGLVETPLSARLLEQPAARKASEERHPLGRVGHPEDVAQLACLLLTDAGSFITGQVISVDGGLAHLRPTARRTVG